MKKFFRRIHLYLGLIAGAVIMITCITGAMLVFEEELQHAFNKERYYVAPQQNRLPLAQIIANFKQSVKAKPASVKVYTDARRSLEISYSEAVKKGAKLSASKPSSLTNTDVRKTAFIDPYTGKILELYNYQDSFFYTVFSLHRWLLNGDTGKLITGVCTLIFLFIIITGIILWWPKTKRILLQRLKIKTNAGWKRTNHDLHIVLGFYSAIFLFVFAFTALAWSFEWFNNGIYSVTGSSKEMPKPPISVQEDQTTISVDDIYAAARQYIRQVKYYSIAAPKDSAGVYTVNVLSNSAAHETATDTYYFDQYNGKLIHSFKFSDRNAGQQIRATFKPVHTGAVFGLPSKIISFIVCLLGATFPVTGIVMWINRTMKKRNKKVSVNALTEEVSQ